MKKPIDQDEHVFRTPRQLAARWSWHEESVRRKIRNGEIGSVHIGRRVLVSVEEIERLENEGTIKAVV